MKFKGKNVPYIVFVFICHTELDDNYKKIQKKNVARNGEDAQRKL